MSLPTFVVAGTQKAATTWLYECMNEHPQVHVPDTKELHFFCPHPQCDKSRAGRGQNWYLEQFDVTPPHRVSGEFSIDYMYYPDIAAKLRDLNPDLKVMFILRDPVERAYSAYWMKRRNRTDFAPFADFIQPDNDLVARGLYHRQIERYRAVFPEDQILVLIYEDIAKDPYAFAARAFEFIGVDPTFRPASAEQVIAETKQMQPVVSMVFYLYASRILRFRPALWAWRAFKRLSGFKRRAASADKGSKYPPMAETERERLLAIYDAENEKLFAALGRQVKEWTA